MIILFYGQPAAGKTTLADELHRRLQSFIKFTEYFHEYKFVRIDGDKWRDITNNKDYSKEGRNTNLKGAFNMALYLENEGFIPILSFVTPYDELRKYLKENSKHLVEIYLEYQGDRGRNDRFAKDFEVTDDYNLKINTTYRSVSDCVNEVIDYCAQNFK
jgi:adenylylsulfate kinase-like enzyme